MPLPETHEFQTSEHEVTTLDQTAPAYDYAGVLPADEDPADYYRVRAPKGWRLA